MTDFAGDWPNYPAFPGANECLAPFFNSFGAARGIHACEHGLFYITTRMIGFLHYGVITA